jgi:hypothetical protein
MPTKALMLTSLFAPCISIALLSRKLPTIIHHLVRNKICSKIVSTSIFFGGGPPHHPWKICRSPNDLATTFLQYENVQYYTEALITNKCTKGVLSSIATHSYMFRPCWVSFRVNFFVIIMLRLRFIVAWECAVFRELSAVPVCRPEKQHILTQL